MTKRVLVTGANGHVGNALVRHLCERGYAVRASVRDPSDPEKTAPLAGLGCEIVACDILDEAQVAAAVDGMDGVFHVAAVYALWARDPEREIIAPSVEGVQVVLKACARAKVPRVVLTSSVAAVGFDGPADRPLDEASWTEGSNVPYFEAKTRAEQVAWELAEHRGG